MMSLTGNAGRVFALVMSSMIGTTLNAAENAEVKIKFAECPKAVRKTIEREANGVKISEVDKEVKDGKTIYEVDFEIDETNYEVTVAENGKLLGKVIDEEEEEEDKDDEDGKAKQSELSKLPAAVQKTAKREACGSSIAEVEKETDHGKTVYEFVVKIDGEEYEVKVAENGKLISKSLADDEDDEEDDDKEDHKKEGKKHDEKKKQQKERHQEHDEENDKD